ncbi:MAG: SdpI family protein [Clostridia bacterium]|nr:SdpI family protein [Clostridia bacterium]
MIKTHKRTLLITSVLILLPMLAGLLLWNRLPDTLATHFGSDNVPNGFSSKPFAVFGLPLFVLACQWFSVLITANDPKRQNISGKVFVLTLWVCPAVSLLSGAVIYGYALGLSLNIGRVAQGFVGVLFALIGNYLPKCRQSYTMGIKLPWTLADEENWRRTHRLGGFLWMLGGGILLLCALLDIRSFYVQMITCIAMVLLPVGYSFLYARRRLPDN